MEFEGAGSGGLAVLAENKGVDRAAVASPSRAMQMAVRAALLD